MSGKTLAVVVSLLVGGSAASVAARGSAPQAPETRTMPRQQGQPRGPLDQLRYQIGTMERVLENAVEHGAAIWRDRLQAVVPSQTLLLDNARARGYRLEGYGVFFDVRCRHCLSRRRCTPVFRTLDENGLGLQSALNQLKTYVQAAGDANLEQALKRVELQVSPVVPATTVAPASGARQAGGAGPCGAGHRIPGQRRSDSELIPRKPTVRRSPRRSSMPCSITAARWASAATSG